MQQITHTIADAETIAHDRSAEYNANRRERQRARKAARAAKWAVQGREGR